MRVLTYILIFLFATEGVFTIFNFNGLSIVRLFEVFYFFLIFNHFLRDSQTWFINKTRVLLLFLVFCILLKFISIVIIQQSTSFTLIYDLLKLVVYFIHIYLLYYLVDKDIKYLKFILIINLPILIIAFFQSDITPLTDLAWLFKQNYFQQISSLYEHDIYFLKRVNGLYSSSLPLSYALLSNMIMSSYLKIKTNKNIYLYYFIFVGIITLFTLSRSLLAAYFVIFFYLFFNRINLISVFLLVLAFLFASFIFRDYGENFQRIFTKDGSNRIDFAITGLQAILEYPAGISDENYLYIKQLNSVSFNNVGVLLLESHNGFVNAALQYTMFGAIGFFIYIRLLFNKLIKSNQIKYFMFIVTAYSIHIFHHNQVLFVNDFFNTIILVIVGLEINNQKSK